MTKAVIQSLQSNPTVTKSLSKFVINKRVDFNKFIATNTELDNFGLILEFCTKIYGLEVLCRSDGFDVYKSGKRVVDIRVKSVYDNLLIVLYAALFNYCENPF